MISIIMPVYNVEDYLCKSVDSVLAQTYTDWELLLIDDGSTDNSGNMCDEYEKKDARICCYHKINGGLSSARNFGIDKCAGECVVFLDSDDWLAPEFLEVCITEYLTHKADIVTANYYMYYNEADCIPRFETNKKVNVCTNTEAMKKLMCNDGTSSAVWARIYNKDILKDLRFEEGMRFEDAAISYKFFIKANTVVFVPKPLMYYYQRPKSIMSNRDKKIRLDEIRAGHERYGGGCANYIMTRLQKQLFQIMYMT